MISGRWAVQIQVTFIDKLIFPSSCRNLCSSKQGVEYAEPWLKLSQAHTESKINPLSHLSLSAINFGLISSNLH